VVGDEIVIRQATVADIPDLVRLRRIMFEAMGWSDAAKLDASDVACQAYFAEAIPAGAFYGWLAVIPSGEAVGSGGLVVDQHPPTPGNLLGQVGYIMSVVTVPSHRRRGVARRMMQVMLEWLAERGVQRATLHATDMGRSLYRELGFVDSDEMRLESHTPPRGTRDENG